MSSCTLFIYRTITYEGSWFGERNHHVLKGEPIFPWSFQMDLFSTIIIPTTMHRIQNLHYLAVFTIFRVLCAFLGLLCL